MKKPAEIDVIAWVEREMQEDVIPPGWATPEQIAKATGKDVDVIRMRLARAARKGDLLVQKINLVADAGGIRKSVIYATKGTGNGKATAAPAGRGRRGRGGDTAAS